MSLVSRTALTLLAGLVAVPMTPVTQTSPSGSPVARQATPVAYDATQKEFYLAADQTTWIRPGLNIKIVSVTNVAPGQKPVVEILMTDDLGQPLDRLGKVTPGPLNPGIIMGAWDTATRYYIAYTGTPAAGPVTSAGRDQGGTFTDLEVGHFKYNFGQAIPATHDVNKTITIGVYGTRTMSDIVGKDYYAPNVFYDFRTDGKPAAANSVWNNMDVAKSCNLCHDPLGGAFGATQFHGGTRQTVKMCVLCHNATKGTNGQADAKLFFHKLHMGKYLPSVLAGTPYVMDGDWSTVGWPGNNNKAPFDCTTCHETSAPEKDVWYTRPTRLVCGSCHDNINWTTGANHAGGQQINDKSCSNCHDPVQDAEFDASIIGAHTIPLKSTQLKGLKASIVSVTNLAAGKKPTVVVKITNNDGTAVDGSKLGTFAPIFAGPTTSYTTYVRESAVGKAIFDTTAGTSTYTFTAALPAKAAGTWAVSCDIERAYSIARGDGKPDITGNESPLNPMMYVALTDAVAVPRRVSVTMAQCNKCHGALGLHGGQRLVIEECVMCHNPTADDSPVRPADQMPAESISLQRMIHRIHSGDALIQDFTIYGNRASLHNYNEVRFPGDRRNCAKCHTSTGYLLPLANKIDSVTTNRDFFSPEGPGTAACTGCHDSRDVAAHALINTAYFPGSTVPAEACATCHGAGATYAVNVVHAR
jgi:OmcA/MtrC family decaheme c-type cytochrome